MARRYSGEGKGSQSKYTKDISIPLKKMLEKCVFFAVSRGGFGRDDHCQRLFSLNSSERKQSVCVNCWKMEKKSQALPETQFSKARHPLEF